MIVQIQGTSGSGKSTLVRALMKAAQRVQPLTGNSGNASVEADYRLHFGHQGRTHVYVVGKYATPCGGCDQVGSSAEVLRRVRAFAKRGHVVFEGLLLSGGQGTLGRAMLRYGRGFAYAFLDTPLELCLQRVQARREARAQRTGVAAKLLNPKNTTSKWHACQRYHLKAHDLGYRVALLKHKRPLPPLLELLGVK
jgi:ABC-type dipeptide/oligopeptide/nickel transport system ATPase component